VQHGIRELTYFRLHGCRKHQGLPLLRNFLKNSSNGRKESHVKHTVGFVKHEDFETLKIDITLLHQIKQPAWSRDNDVDARPQGTYLRLLPNTTVHRRHAYGGKGPVVHETFMNLDRQFSCAGQHKHLNPPSTCRSSVSRQVNLMQKRQREGSRLPCSGLSDADNVSTG
jgi:hypothetical protein